MMDDLLRNLRSPDWWVTAVIAGLLMSVLAAYVKGWLDTGFASSSRTWRTFRESQRQRRAARIRFAATSDRGFVELLARETRARLRLVAWLLLMIAFLFPSLMLVGAGIETNKDFWNWLYLFAAPRAFMLLAVQELFWIASARQEQRRASQMNAEVLPGDRGTPR
jgi:hypothetical protein